MPIADAAFERAVVALRPYLGDLVIAGAWAHKLLRLHPLASPPDFAPLSTRDADLAAPEHLEIRGSSIPDLLVGAGFREVLRGGDPPAAEYHATGDEAGPYVEFIAPLSGPETDRHGAPRNVAIVAGAAAARLRFVDLLLVDPWELRLPCADVFQAALPSLSVRVASPAAYLAQKALSLPRRRDGAKKANDMLHLSDTLTLFGAHLAELREPASHVLAHLRRTTRRELSKLCANLWSDAALLQEAAAIAEKSGRPAPPTPERISTICRFGLRAVLDLQP